ncbi:MAG: NEW3 domain-containing protein [Anaerolineae bacterium]
MLTKRFVSLSLTLILLAALAAPVAAQEETPPVERAAALSLTTDYPVRKVVAGESVTFDLTVHGGATGETVYLDVQNLPEGWTATFKGGGDIIEAVYVEPEKTRPVELKIELPQEAAVDSYEFDVIAQGEEEEAQLTLGLTVEEKMPPRLTFDVELPTLKGKATSTFNYDVTLKNESNEDLSVNLIAEAPADFEVTFSLLGKEVTSFPIGPNETKRLDVKVNPPSEVKGGTYQIKVLAEAGKTQAQTTLIADVTEVPGKPELDVTGPGGRLSTNAYVGKETTLKVIVRNTGDAPATNVKMTSSEPSGWSVTFEPETIPEIGSNTEAEVTAKIKPADKAVAGDYEITIRARPEDGTSESADFRITVRTSTLWGVVGVGIIAVAVVIVGLAVMRYGRR